MLNIYFFEINSKVLSGSEFWSLINEPNIIVNFMLLFILSETCLPRLSRTFVHKSNLQTSVI